MFTKQEIIPLSKKMREKVKQHGKVWWVKVQEEPVPASRWHLRTLLPVHKGGHPYELWAEVNKDFKFDKGRRD